MASSSATWRRRGVTICPRGGSPVLRTTHSGWLPMFEPSLAHSIDQIGGEKGAEAPLPRHTERAVQKDSERRQKSARRNVCPQPPQQRMAGGWFSKRRQLDFPRQQAGAGSEREAVAQRTHDSLTHQTFLCDSQQHRPTLRQSGDVRRPYLWRGISCDRASIHLRCLAWLQAARPL